MDLRKDLTRGVRARSSSSRTPMPPDGFTPNPSAPPGPLLALLHNSIPRTRSIAEARRVAAVSPSKELAVESGGWSGVADNARARSARIGVLAIHGRPARGTTLAAWAATSAAPINPAPLRWARSGRTSNPVTAGSDDAKALTFSLDRKMIY